MLRMDPSDPIERIDRLDRIDRIDRLGRWESRVVAITLMYHNENRRARDGGPGDIGAGAVS